MDIIKTEKPLLKDKHQNMLLANYKKILKSIHWITRSIFGHRLHLSKFKTYFRHFPAIVSVFGGKLKI